MFILLHLEKRSKLHYYRENKIPNSVKVEASTVQIIFKVHVILHLYEGIVRQIGLLIFFYRNLTLAYNLYKNNLIKHVRYHI